MTSSSVVIAVGILSGLAAYHVVPEIGLISGLFVIIFTSWFMYGLTSPGRIISGLAHLKNPPLGSFIAFGGSFVYFSFGGYPGQSKFLASLGVGLIGAAVSISLYKYWNIGG